MTSESESGTRVSSESPERLDELAILIGRVAAGEDSALETLYDYTVGKVYGLALAISKSSEDAEEITCDVYTQVWVKAGDFDTARGNGMAWLMTICRSRALDLLRRNQKHSVDVVTSTQANDATETDLQTPEVMLSQLQDHAGVTQALKALSDIQRQAVMLAFFRGSSHGDVAATLGLPLGTVKSHLRRALQSLHKSLDLSP